MTQKPVPIPDLESAPYWEAARQHRLQLPRCQQCGYILFPPRPECPECQNDQLDWTGLSGRGVVYTYCIMRTSLIAGFEPPYVIAVVELDEQAGSRVTANIVDCPVEAVRIGMPVEVAFEDRTPEVTLPQFRPRSLITGGMA